MPAGVRAAPRPAPAAVLPEGERLRLFDAVGRFLAGASSKRPIVVVLHAARGGRAIAVAAAVPGGGAGKGEGPASLSSRGRKEDPASGLAWGDIEAYAAAVTGSTVSGQAIARLHEVTGGNPYFLGEVVRLLGAGDTLDSLGEPARDPLLRIPEEIRVLIRRPRGGASSRAVAALGRRR